MMCAPAPAESAPDAQAAKTAPSPKQRGEGWLLRSVAIVSLCGIVLSLFGYGVALAAESQFGVPHSVVFTSPFELLELSVVGVAQLIIGLGSGLKRIDLYWTLLAAGWPLFLMAIAFWSLLVWGVKFRRAERAGGRKAGFIASLLRKPDLHAESSGQLMARGLVYSLACALGGPLTVLLGVVLVAAICTVLAIVPIVGMSAGEAHIRERVIGPTKCRPLADYAARLAAKRNEFADPTTDKVAHCTAVLAADGRPLARGRVVFATSEAVLLYDPGSGAVRRVPVKDQVVDVLNTL